MKVHPYHLTTEAKAAIAARALEIRTQLKVRRMLREVTARAAAAAAIDKRELLP